MVARGDLGVEIPHEDVPGRQKELVRLPSCRHPGDRRHQMLDSMVSLTPTCAEAWTSPLAIYDGADAVMLGRIGDRELIRSRRWR